MSGVFSNTAIVVDSHGAANGVAQEMADLRTELNTALMATHVTSSTDAQALPLTADVINITTAGAETRTLAAGTNGKTMLIRMKTDGGDCVLTLTGNPAATDTVTFNDAGDFVLLMYADGQWLVLVNSGCTVA